MRRFRYLLRLAGKSAWNRRGTLLLVVLSVALSTTLLLGIEKLRTQVRESFVQSVSGTDLIVGARGGTVQLVLYAVFHLGGTTNEMSWESARKIAERQEVAWTIPIALGDSHKGYPVVATSDDFFEHYRFRGDRRIVLDKGHRPEALFDVAVGAEAARKLGYAPGQKIVLSHGDGGSGLAEHGERPFTVAGVLAPTGTPVDRSLYIGLQAMEAIHSGGRDGAPDHGPESPHERAAHLDLEPEGITALFVGLRKRGQVFAMQREINEWKAEALMGVMPGVAMDQIGSLIDTGERALLLVSVLVTVTGLAGLAAAILAGLGERRRELAVLRSTGARPLDIWLLMACEGFLLLVSGMALGVSALFLSMAVIRPVLADRYGVFISLSPPTSGEWMLLGGICLAGLAASLIPASRAYRMSLSDGLTIAL